MFLLRNKKKIFFYYPQYPLLSGTLILLKNLDQSCKTDLCFWVVLEGRVVNDLELLWEGNPFVLCITVKNTCIVKHFSGFYGVTLYFTVNVLNILI